MQTLFWNGHVEFRFDQKEKEEIFKNFLERKIMAIVEKDDEGDGKSLRVKDFAYYGILRDLEKIVHTYIQMYYDEKYEEDCEYDEERERDYE